jgi:kinesin family protein 14
MRKVDNRRANLVNLNEDPQLSEMLIYILKDGAHTHPTPSFPSLFSRVSVAGETVVGCTSSADVQLGGALIQDQHAVITCSHDAITIVTIGEATAFVNGMMLMHAHACMHVLAQLDRASDWSGVQLVSGKTLVMQHGDRIVFGNSHFFRLNIPRPDRPRYSTHIHHAYLHGYTTACMHAETQQEGWVK